MLAIRLSRIGRKNRPSYRVIVSEKSKDTFGTFLEILGFYDPFSKTSDFKKERIEHWLSKGAKISPTLHNLFIDKNIIQEVKLKIKRGKKKDATEPNIQSKSEETPKI